MLIDLDESLQKLLETDGMTPDWVEISFAPISSNMAAVARPTVNLYLYDLTENTQYRETSLRERQEGLSRALRRHPLRIDATYRVSCWAQDPETEHNVLWRVLEILYRRSPLTPETLQGALKSVSRPLPTRVAQPAQSATSATDYWSSLGGTLRPSFNFSVTLELELDREWRPAGKPILVRRLRSGGLTGESPRVEQVLAAHNAVLFHGTVLDEEGRPLPEVNVSVWSTNRKMVIASAETDDRGTYVLTVRNLNDELIAVHAQLSGYEIFYFTPSPQHSASIQGEAKVQLLDIKLKRMRLLASTTEVS